MESHFGTFAAATALLGNLVQSCLAVSSFWEKIEHADEEANLFIVRLDGRLSALHWWSTRWKIIDDEASSIRIPDARFQVYGNAIANYLELILHTLHHLTSHQDDVPIFKNTRAAHTSNSSERLAMLLNTRWEAHLGASTTNANEDKSGFGGRLKWALKNGRAIERLKVLESLIQDLQELFPPPGPSYDLSGAVLVNPALMTEQGVWRLRWLSRQGDIDPFAASLAWLKHTSISHIYDLKVSSGSDSQRQLANLERYSCPGDATHYTTEYNGSSMLIERKIVPREADNNVLKLRIEKVIHLLKASQSIQELRTLPCIGYLHRQPGEDGLSPDDEYCVYEILYTIPTGSTLSLNAMIKDSNKYQPELSLDKRFEIARILSRAVLYLHVAEWLHKGIRSHNVMFCSSEESATRSADRFGHPYIVGFEYSRVSSKNEGTENSASSDEDNLYRHPMVQGPPVADTDSYIGNTGRFTKDHDIYSLGVTLTEIGLLMTASQILDKLRKTKNYTHTPKNFRDKLIEKFVPTVVAFKMGQIYADVTIRCLRADFYSLPKEDSRESSVEFYKHVVSQLDLCRA
ncbi:uncharacterized protein TRUGW13939_06989 [Talaromyces rugulosus]|uniref:Protein kinase domain-containing protein n=1 Tax=Talaromyces rugulosus TaxID=121627 RepID=A0A7H8R0X2_TALRU|nr:uncharacterized protein TRUGW13939_06989 [Talaromyces rugulosus]QKX59847.1 hypothetical protein TRUGW13939_06989 [Talaromyces rugulosus]